MKIDQARSAALGMAIQAHGHLGHEAVLKASQKYLTFLMTGKSDPYADIFLDLQKRAAAGWVGVAVPTAPKKAPAKKAPAMKASVKKAVTKQPR